MPMQRLQDHRTVATHQLRLVHVVDTNKFNNARGLDSSLEFKLEVQCLSLFAYHAPHIYISEHITSAECSQLIQYISLC